MLVCIQNSELMEVLGSWEYSDFQLQFPEDETEFHHHMPLLSPPSMYMYMYLCVLLGGYMYVQHIQDCTMHMYMGNIAH